MVPSNHSNGKVSAHEKYDRPYHNRYNTRLKQIIQSKENDFTNQPLLKSLSFTLFYDGLLKRMVRKVVFVRRESNIRTTFVIVKLLQPVYLY